MLQLSLLLISFLGYFMLMHILFRGRKMAFYPAILSSVIIAACFLAGLGGKITEAYSSLYYAGFLLIPVCGVYYIRKRKIVPLPPLHTVFPLLILVGASYLLLYLLRDRFLYALDDFSHWGKIARIISTDLRLPVEADQLTHGSYPPGTALFIGYVSSIIGNSEGVWLFAQAMLMVCFWLPLLSSTRNIILQLALSCIAVFFMQYVNSIETLYVDTLLAAAAFACVMICLKEQRKADSHILPLTFMLSALVLIKNSGVFLAAIIAVYAIILYFRKKRAFSIKLPLLVLPFIVMIAWNTYFSEHFTQITGHQMSAEYYKSILGDKSSADIAATIRMILPMIFDPRKNHALCLIPGFALVLFILKNQQNLKANAHIAIFSAVLFLLYEIGMLAMYIFSMPMAEVIEQGGADYYRYNSTIILILMGLLLYLSCQISFALPREMGAARFACAIAVVVIAAGSVLSLVALQVRPFRSRGYRVWTYETAHFLHSAQKELSTHPSDASYIVLCDTVNTEPYSRYVTRYHLHTGNIERFHDREEAMAAWKESPWKYFVDLQEYMIQHPLETIGIDLFTENTSIEFDNVLESVGYQENTRYSVTAGKDVEAPHWDITGYIPVKTNSTIYLKNIDWYPSSENDARGGVSWFSRGFFLISSENSFTEAGDLADWNPVFDANGNVTQITVPEDVDHLICYLRITCQDIRSDSVIYVVENGSE